MGKKNKKTSKEDFDRGLMSKFYGPGKEAQDMLKRYDVEGYSHGRTDRGSEYRGVDEVKKDLAAAMMNDYDTRRTMEAAAMAGNKDAKKFAKKGFKSGNLQDAYGVMRDLKKEYVGGGGMDGAKNRAGLTYAAVKADREAQTAAYDETYAKTTDLNAMKEELMAQATEKAAGNSDPIEPSDRFAAVQDRLEGAASNKPPSLFDKDNAAPAKADDQADAARNFLDDYKLDVTKGANLKHDIETGLSNAARTVRDTYGR